MNEEKRKSEAISRLNTYLAQHHLRRTPEREMILSVVMAHNRSFTPAAINGYLLQQGLNLSKATVYNTLSLFEHAGITRRLLSDRKEIIYETIGGSARHILLVCKNCGRQKEVHNSELARTINLHRFPAFSSDGFELLVHGLCSKCRNSGHKN